MPTAIVVVDISGAVALMNPAAEQLFGYRRCELLGQPVEVLLPTRLRESHLAERASFSAAPSPRPIGRGRDLVARHKDGTEIPVEIGLNPLVIDEEPFVLSAIVDITGRKRAEAEREDLLVREQAALAEARAASRAKDEFLSTLSHELRTPLNAVLGWVQVVRSGGLDSEELNRGLERIERNAQLQARLVSDILDVSRIIQGKFHLDLGPCDPAAIVESAINNLRLAASAKRITLQLTAGPVRPIRADAERLEQIVWNLVSNAVKFSPNGSAITVEVLDAGSHLKLRVSDEGKGIAPDFLPRVFDRFTQADSSSTRDHGGLGLGLAIVRHLVELHGGAVTAESEGEGKGATFTVALPWGSPKTPAESSVGQGGPTPAAAEARPGLPRLEGLRLLVVDDEPDTRDLLRQYLSQLGATVTAVGSVTEALAAIDELRPGVVVSDVAMPGEDGYAFIRELRARAPELPALALTAFVGPESHRALLDAGFQLCLSKPADLSRLAGLIAELAGRSA